MGRIIMKEDYVSFETAKLLKEKGFDEYCSGYYKFDKSLGILSKAVINNSALDDDGIDISAPTHQMVLAWLREKHKIHIEVEVYYCEDGQMWLAKIQRIESANTVLVKTCMVNNTYEEAIETAIKYCLENLIQ